jgi:hypothetical protein
LVEKKTFLKMNRDNLTRNIARELTIQGKLGVERMVVRKLIISLNRQPNTVVVSQTRGRLLALESRLSQDMRDSYVRLGRQSLMLSVTRNTPATSVLSVINSGNNNDGNNNSSTSNNTNNGSGSTENFNNNNSRVVITNIFSIVLIMLGIIITFFSLFLLFNFFYFGSIGALTAVFLTYLVG